MGAVRQAFETEAREMKLLQLWRDFQYVRKHCNMPMKGVTRFPDGSAEYHMSPETLEYNRRCFGLPDFLYGLAALTSVKPK